MATFAELCSDVKTITKRPELDAEIKLAVKAATLKLHHSDFYAKDLAETGISWASPAYIQSLDFRTIFPRFRALKYLRKYADSLPGKFFTLLTPDDVLDSYNIHKEDIVYLAGSMLEIRSSTQDAYMLFSYYQHPDIVEATYNSWIALEHPFAIVYEAAGIVFKQIGFDEQASQFNMLSKEILTEIRLSNTVNEGF